MEIQVRRVLAHEPCGTSGGASRLLFCPRIIRRQRHRSDDCRARSRSSSAKVSLAADAGGHRDPVIQARLVRAPIAQRRYEHQFFPTIPASRLFLEFERMLDVNFGLQTIKGNAHAALNEWSPAADIHETEEALTFTVELPGLRRIRCRSRPRRTCSPFARPDHPPTPERSTHASISSSGTMGHSYGVSSSRRTSMRR